MLRLPLPVAYLIDRTHVSTSNYDLIKLIYNSMKKNSKRKFWQCPKEQRKMFYELIIQRHESNAELYFNVMSGRF